MSRFRASDEQIDREIAALEGIARVRLRRTIAEMRELDHDLKELRREKARRKAASEVPGLAEAEAASDAVG